MPDIVAARPAAGAVVESSWGQQVHDLIESGGILARTEFTAPVGITGTTEAAATTIVTAPAVVLAAPAILQIEFDCGALFPPNAANGSLILVVFENGVAVGRLNAIQAATASAGWIYPGGAMRGRRSVAAGTYTYSVRGHVSSGTGTVYVGAGGAGAYFPGAITVRSV